MSTDNTDYTNPEPDGAMGAGPADAPDLATHDGGDATGGGSPGDPDDMGATDGFTLEELAAEYGADGRPTADEEGEA